MSDDELISDIVRRTNTLAFRSLDNWRAIFLDFLDLYIAALEEQRDWNARLKAHMGRIHEEPQLRWEQRPEEATDEWQRIHYTDPFTRYWVCRWPEDESKIIVMDGYAPACVYPREVQPYKYDIIWDAYAWTPPDLLPESEPVEPVILLDEGGQCQDSDLGGRVFALTCFHDLHGPQLSANIRPINPWGYGIGPGRYFTGNKDEYGRANIFLVKMVRAGLLGPKGNKRIADAIDSVEKEFVEADEPDQDKSANVERDQHGTTHEPIEWSAPMAKAEMARRITGKPSARSREVEALLSRFGLEHVEGHRFRVRVDKMDAATRKKIERSA